MALHVVGFYSDGYVRAVCMFVKPSFIYND